MVVYADKMGVPPQHGEMHASSEVPRGIRVDDADADRAFEALATSTARTILPQLYEQPSSPTDRQDMIETSIQTVRYHREQ